MGAGPGTCRTPPGVCLFARSHPFPLMAILTVPKVLREKLGDEGVEALIALLNEAAHHERNNLLGILEERFERRVTEEGKRLDNRIAEEVAKLDRRITEEVARLDHRITEEVAKLDRRITEEVARLDRRITEEVKRLEVLLAETEKRLDHRITEEVSRLEVALSERYASLVRWMFIFWAGQIGVLVALFALLR